ncbi:MAG: anti-sigma factor antagonist [Caldithrix sp.]|jgi:anti-sigma B factor antagonist|nr:anti-sigma factor antagonist [Caldithrix sp.]
MQFNIHTITDKDIIVIDAPKRLTSDISDDLKSIMKEYVDREKYNIIINLEETEFIDSSGLGAIVSKISITRSNNGDIKLAAPQRYVVDLLEVTHLNKVIEILDSVEEAIEGFEK